MDTDKKKYRVVLPINGYNEGDIAELTEAEAANFNGGEPTPRVVEYVEEGEASEKNEAPASAEDSTPPADTAGEGGENSGEGGASDAGNENA